MRSEDEIEQEFFRVFGIDEQCICPYLPAITTEKLLRMICVLNEHYCNNYQCATMLVGDTIEQIKECVLKDCIEQSQHIKSKIQQIFKEDNQ